MKRILFFVLLLSSLILQKNAMAQITNVNVTIVATPPYSPYLTDYLIYENRTAIIVTAIGTPGSTQKIYFKGSITGDNGVSIKTKNNYYPSNYLTLTANLPKRLTGSEIKDFLDWNYVDITGVSVAQVVRNNGVPEGNYKICFQAFDYDTKQPIGIENCSNNITIQHVDPPLPTSPSCESDVNQTTPQNVMFSWTYNPGVSRSTRYLLKIVELIGRQNANDAINSQTTPAFFEKTISSINYLYTAIDPALKPGKKYAWRVKAYDLDNKIKFKNNGESEVCTFIYKAKEIVPTPPVPPPPPAPNNNNNTVSQTLKITVPYNNSAIVFDNQNNFLVSWLTKEQYEYFNSSKYKNPNKYDNLSKQDKQYLNKVENDMLHQTAGWRFYFNVVDFNEYLKNGKQIKNCKSVWAIDTIKSNENFSVDVNHGDLIPLKNKERYVVQISARDKDGKNWKSDEVVFTFKNNWVKPVKKIESLLIHAKINYRYNDATDEMPMYSTPYGIYDIWYIQNDKGNVYRLPSNKFKCPIGELANGTVTNATADFYIQKDKLDTTNGYGLIKEQYSASVLLGNSYHTVSGKLFHALYLLPYSPYYVYTENYIFPKFNKDVSAWEKNGFDAGKLVYTLYDYDATIRLHKKYFVDGKEIVDDNSKYLEGKTVYILRKKYPALTPTYDGDGSGNHENYTLNGVNYWIIDKHNAIKAKDSKGNDVVQVDMKNLICNWLPDDEYYLYVEGEPLSCLTKARFAPSAPVNIFKFHYHREFDYYLVSATPPPSVVSGKLIYKYADDGETETYPLAYKNVSVKSYLVWKENGGKEKLYRTKQDLIYDLTYNYASDATVKKLLENVENESLVLDTKTTDADGNFTFKIPYSFIVNGTTNFGTAGGGEFKFPGGVLKHVLRVIVNDKYFCSPDDNIDVQPFQATNTGTLKAMVKSFGLKINVIAKDKNINKNYSNNGKINGAKVKVIRYNPDLVYSNWGVPKTEGAQSSDPMPDNNLGKTISIGNTDNNGLVVFKRMIRHAGYSPYDYYYVKAETDNASNYNYAPQSKSDFDFNLLGRTTKLGDKGANDIYADEFVSEYKYTNCINTFFLESSWPLIEGRMVNANSANKGIEGGVALFSARYSDGNKFFNSDVVSFTDENGYFQNNDIMPIYDATDNPKNQPKVNLLLVKDGYTNVEDGKSFCIKSEPSLKWGQRINYKDIPFATNAKFTCVVHDEEGKTVEAFARIGDDIDDSYQSGAFFGAYQMDAPSGKNQKLYILPLDPKYYADTITIPEIKPGNKNFYQPEIIIRIRKHRIIFKITDDETGKPIMGAYATFVELAGTPQAITDAKGWTPKIEFLNIATHHFNVKISAWGYGTSYLQIENYEQKSGEKIYYAKLKKGLFCTGTVKLDGKPLENATVYMDAGLGMPLIYGKTEKDGQYVVFNLPDPAIYNYDKLYVKASPGFSANVTAVAQAKWLTVVKGTAVYKMDFDLTTLPNVDLTKLLGYPIMLTAYKDKGNNKATISGIMNFDENNNNYKPLLQAEGIEFNDVEIVTTSYYNAKMNKTFYQSLPTSDSIALNIWKWKIKANNEFNIELSNYKQKRIQLFKTEQNNGTVMAKAKLIDNSFNVPSSYLSFADDQFYLYKNDGGSKNARPIFFTNTSIKNVDYHLSIGDKYFNPIKFQYFGFEGKSNEDAYLEDNKIVLPAVLSTVTPEGFNISDIKAGKLILHNTSFEPVKGTEPLSFKFEQWQVVVKDWMLDNSKGGFSANNATFKTGVIDVTCNQFIFKAKHLPFFDGFNMDNLTLGGLVPVYVNNNATKHIGYDLQTGTDNKAHWKLSLVGKDGMSAATVKNIPGTKSNIEIVALSLISNGEALFTLPSNAPALQYSCGVTFTPSTFSMPINQQGIANSFALQGTLTTGIPRTQDNVSAQLIFSGKPNNLKMELAPLNFDFEGKGFVKFKSFNKNQLLSENEFSLEGTVEEPGKLTPINVKLHRKSDAIYIEEFNPGPIAFGSKQMNKIKCNMKVNDSNHDWGYLSFNGYMEGFEGMKKGDPEAAHFYFTVYGEIKAEGQQVKMDGINTPFGDLQITFDYEKARLTGILKMDGIDFGGNAVSGQANFLMDKGGFFMVAAVEVQTQAAGNFSGGLLVGKYADYTVLEQQGAIKTLLTYAFDKHVPCTFQKDGLAGFMVMGRRDIKPIPDFDLNLVVVSVSLKATAGVDARVYMNLAGNLTFGIGVVAFAEVNLVCSSITCTKIDGFIKAQAKVAGEYVYGKGMAIDGCGSVKLHIHGEQCLPNPFAGGCSSPCIDLGKDFGIAYKVRAAQGEGLTQKILWGEECVDTQDCP
ncbi:MAG: hypothetical protein RIQ33_759 [Bacteroidota bacterium]